MILSKKSFISAGSSAVSQAASFATSIVLTSSEGALFYGELGLAFVTLQTFIFLLDLGFGLYFSREVSLGNSNWEARWSLMLGLKLVFAMIFSPILVGSWWWIYGKHNIGTQYLLLAWPAAFISIFNITPILYGLGRVKEASFALLIVPSMYLLITVIAVNLNNKEHLPVILGAGYLISWLCQPFFFLLKSSDIFSYKVKLSLTVMPLVIDSFRVWRIALVGALYDRLCSFIIASISPAFIAYYLLCDQAIQALVTLFMQAQRAHFPDIAIALEKKRSWVKVTRYCINFQLVFIIFFNIAGIIFHWKISEVIFLNGFDREILLYLFSGLLLICSAPLFGVLFLLRGERSIFNTIVFSHLITLSLGFLTLYLENLYLAIGIRALDAILVWFGFLFYLKNYLKLESILLFTLGLMPLVGIFSPFMPHEWLITPLIAISISIVLVLKINLKTKGGN